ncbi:MAG TPA: hypothetical protein VKX16_16175 [Chloroflexota bacterium]|nr:hypothetical protein [Chloroflexota bacterium]
MYRTWTASAEDAESLARALEAHLNEFAEEVISVGYAVTGSHHVLAVYRELEGSLQAGAVVAVAEQILDESNV